MPLETAPFDIAPLDITLGLALAAGLLVYLLAALIAPERF